MKYLGLDLEVDSLEDFKSLPYRTQIRITETLPQEIEKYIVYLEDFISLPTNRYLLKSDPEFVLSLVKTFSDLLKLGNIQRYFIESFPRYVINLTKDFSRFNLLESNSRYYLLTEYLNDIKSLPISSKDILNAESEDLDILFYTRDSYVSILKSCLFNIDDYDNLYQVVKNNRKRLEELRNFLPLLINTKEDFLSLDTESQVYLYSNDKSLYSKLNLKIEDLLTLPNHIQYDYLVHNQAFIKDITSEYFYRLSHKAQAYVFDISKEKVLSFIDTANDLNRISTNIVYYIFKDHQEKSSEIIKSLDDLLLLNPVSQEDLVSNNIGIVKDLLNSLEDLLKLAPDAQYIFTSTIDLNFITSLIKSIEDFSKLSSTSQAATLHKFPSFVLSLVNTIKDFQVAPTLVKKYISDNHPSLYSTFMDSLYPIKNNYNLEHIKPEVYEFFRNLELKGIHEFKIDSIKNFREIYNYYINKYVSKDLETYRLKLISENPGLSPKQFQNKFYKDLLNYKEKLISKIPLIPTMEILDLDVSRENLFQEVLIEEKELTGFKSIIKNYLLIKETIWTGMQRPFNEVNHVLLFCVDFHRVSEGLRVSCIEDPTIKEEAEEYLRKGLKVPEKFIKHSAIDNYYNTTNHPYKKGFLTIGWVRYTIFDEDIWIDEVQTDLHRVLGKSDFNKIFKEIELPYIFMKNFISKVRGRGFNKIYYPTYSLSTSLYSRKGSPKLPYTILPEKLRFREGIVEGLDSKIDGEKVWILARQK